MADFKFGDIWDDLEETREMVWEQHYTVAKSGWFSNDEVRNSLITAKAINAFLTLIEETRSDTSKEILNLRGEINWLREKLESIV